MFKYFLLLALFAVFGSSLPADPIQNPGNHVADRFFLGRGVYGLVLRFRTARFY